MAAARMTALPELLELLEDLERRGTSVIELVRQGQPLEPWRVYPGPHGCDDRRTRGRFYYHSHGASHEAGHFHVFRRLADRTTHLAAISMTGRGWPQALFTVNLWAAGDAYESAANLGLHVRRFQVRDCASPSAVVRFVNLVFQAFGPEIERLQEDKIVALARHRVGHPGRNVFEDRALEVLSRVEIDVEARAAEQRAGGDGVHDVQPGGGPARPLTAP